VFCPGRHGLAEEGVALASISLEQRIADTGGRSAGFDYLRIVLAAAVVLWHSFTTAYGNGFAYSFLTTPWRPVVAVIVPMFFALSGWLVAGSLFRNSLPSFIGLRAIRIVPALAVETLLSAFVLGPLLTTVALSTYLTSPVFFKYLCNVIGWIHYQLPGLFLTNPVANRVNGQLWTVPWELWCYASLLIAGWLRIAKARTVFLGLTVLGTIGLFLFEVFVRHGGMDQENGVAPPALLMGFLSAVAIFLWRDKLPWSTTWAIASAVLLVGLLLIPGGDYLIGFPAAYVTIWLGLLNPKKEGFLKSADYSYGLYIYHYAIQQALVFSFVWARQWYIVFPATFVITGAFAAFSWHLIEKPALGLRRHLPHVDRFFASLSRSFKISQAL
jgi:peptidoglycan/LPS O-acetylase OafA/YrhL